MRAELRMNVISDATWMNAARSGFRKPRLASMMPTVSTAIVATKFCQMMRRERRVIVDAVAEHRDHSAMRDELLDPGQLVLRQQVGLDLADAETASDCNG